MKKGMLNLLLVVIFFFIIAVIFIAIHSVNRTINDVKGEIGLGTEAQAVAGDIENSSVKFIDGIALFFIVGFALTSIVSSFFVTSNPFFFIISILLLFVIVFAGAMLSNQYQEFTDDPDYALVEADLTILPTLMNNWPLYAVGIGIITLLGFINFFRGRDDTI